MIHAVAVALVFGFALAVAYWLGRRKREWPAVEPKPAPTIVYGESFADDSPRARKSAAQRIVRKALKK